MDQETGEEDMFEPSRMKLAKETVDGVAKMDIGSRTVPIEKTITSNHI